MSKGIDLSFVARTAGAFALAATLGCPAAAQTEQLRPGSPGVTTYVSPEAQRLYDDALAVFQQSKWAEAEGLYSEFLTRFPFSPLTPNARYRRAVCLNRIGRFVEARQTLREYIERYPTSEEIPRAAEELRFAEAKVMNAPHPPPLPALPATPEGRPAFATDKAPNIVAERPRPAPAAPPPSKAILVEKGVVAVLPLSTRNMDTARREVLEETIRTVAGDALRLKGLTVLTGETTLQVLAENGVDPGKVCEASCALGAARELKARIFISGSAAFTEGEYTAFVRMFDTLNGQQIGSVMLEGKTVKELRQSFQKAAPALFATVQTAP